VDIPDDTNAVGRWIDTGVHSVKDVLKKSL
jgi:hypothetical protein